MRLAAQLADLQGPMEPEGTKGPSLRVWKEVLHNQLHRMRQETMLVLSGKSAAWLRSRDVLKPLSFGWKGGVGIILVPNDANSMLRAMLSKDEKPATGEFSVPPPADLWATSCEPHLLLH